MAAAARSFGKVAGGDGAMSDGEVMRRLLQPSSDVDSVARFLKIKPDDLRRQVQGGQWMSRTPSSLFRTVKNSKGVAIPDELILDVVTDHLAGKPGSEADVAEALDAAADALDLDPDDLRGWIGQMLDRVYTGHAQAIAKAISQAGLPRLQPAWSSSFVRKTTETTAETMIRMYAYAAGISPREAFDELTEHAPRPGIALAIAKALGEQSSETVEKYFKDGLWNRSWMKARAAEMTVAGHRLDEVLETYESKLAARHRLASISRADLDPAWSPDPDAVVKTSSAFKLDVAELLNALARRPWVTAAPARKAPLPRDRGGAGRVGDVSTLRVLAAGPRDGTLSHELAEHWVLAANQEELPEATTRAIDRWMSGAARARRTRKAKEVQRGLDGKAGSALAELEALEGLDGAKKVMRSVIDLVSVDAEKTAAGMKVKPKKFHFRFEGNPGTGKTTAARLFARALFEAGYLKEEKFIEVTASELKKRGEARETTEKKIAEAKGGVLFIDELYMLDPKKDRDGREAAEVLLTAMENEDVVIIGAGYGDDMARFIASNDGFESRFTHKLEFPDYTPDQLKKIMVSMATAQDLKVDDDLADVVIQRLARRRGRGFGNARAVRTTLDKAILRQATRLRDAGKSANRAQLERLTKEDFDIRPPSENIKSLARLDDLVGLKSVKQALRRVANLMKIAELRAAEGDDTEPPPMHALFLGNPGTGKTTVGEIYGQVLSELGYLSDGGVMRVTRADLVGDVLGATAQKTQEILKRARGKVLLIDEAYSLYQGEADMYGKEAIDTIVAHINGNAADDVAVILAGYPKDIEQLLDSNPGLARRFPRQNHFRFDDYARADLGHILTNLSRARGYVLDEDALTGALDTLDRQRMGKGFGNAGAATSLFDASVSAQSERLAAEMANGKRLSRTDLKRITRKDMVPVEASPDEAEQELANLVGLRSVRRKINEYRATILRAKSRGKDPHEMLPPYFRFVGNPGTGKTTVAKLMGKVFKQLGYLPSDEVVEVDAQQLLAGFLGQTGGKVEKIFESALGKTLFIDEAYVLAGGDQYKRDAVDRLLTLTTKYKGQLVVILAGYKDPMNDLMDMNPGLRRRFAEVVDFEDLTAKECTQVFDTKMRENDATLSAGGRKQLAKTIARLKRDENFGNAGEMENLFYQALRKQSLRLGTADGDMTEADILAAEQDVLKSKSGDFEAALSDEEHEHDHEHGHDHGDDHEHRGRPGAETVTVPKHDGMADARVTLVHKGKRLPAKLIIDTGASRVSLSSRLAAELGISANRGRKITMSTANGHAEAREVKIEKIELGGLTARNVDALIVPGNGLSVDGLLGASFLNQFEIVSTDKSFQFRKRARGAADPSMATETSSARPTRTRTRTAQKQKEEETPPVEEIEHEHDHEMSDALSEALTDSGMSPEDMIKMVESGTPSPEIVERVAESLRQARKKSGKPEVTPGELQTRLDSVIKNAQKRVSQSRQDQENARKPQVRKMKMRPIIKMICGVCGREGCPVMPLPRVVGYERVPE